MPKQFSANFNNINMIGYETPLPLVGALFKGLAKIFICIKLLGEIEENTK